MAKPTEEEITAFMETYSIELEKCDKNDCGGEVEIVKIISDKELKQTIFKNIMGRNDFDDDELENVVIFEKKCASCGIKTIAVEICV